MSKRVNFFGTDSDPMEIKEDDPLFKTENIDGFDLQTKEPKSKFPWILFIILLSLLVLVGVILLVGVVAYFGINYYQDNYARRNMIPDGYGPAAVTLARVYGNKDALSIDKYLVGTARTYSSNSWVTDSAAGATAYASCIKTFNKGTGVDSNGQPVITTIEAAKARGFKIGVVVTSRTTHATPAAFTSHVTDRNNEQEIASQQITKGVDILLGGGRNFYLPISKGGKRTDGKDIIEIAQTQYKYNYINTTQQFRNGFKLPVLGLFNSDHLNYEIDQTGKDEITLSEMVTKTIQILEEESQKDSNCPGFFLMIEGSRIDHALHDNDPSTAALEALEYDKTWQVVADYAEKTPRTSVVSVADHETGGLTLGRPYNYGAPNSSMFDWFPENLKTQKASSEFVYYLLIAGQPINETIIKYYGVQPTLDEILAINSTIWDPKDRYTAINNIGRPIGYINWAHSQHTGVDVNVYAIGAIARELRGNIENIDTCKEVAKYLNLDMSQKPPSK